MIGPCPANMEELEAKAAWETHGPVRISADCFRVWARSDPDGLAKLKAERGGLVVRVPVERQLWPNRTMDGG